MPFMARLLAQDVTLEGSIQRAGDRVRVTARLVDVHSATLVWSDSYEYPAQQLTDAQKLARSGYSGPGGGASGCSREIPAGESLILFLSGRCE